MPRQQKNRASLEQKQGQELELEQVPKAKSKRLVPIDMLERKQFLAAAVACEKPIREIAQEWNISPNEICCYIRAYGLRTKKSERLQLENMDLVPPSDKLEESLIELYSNQSLSTIDIGKQWKIHSNAIIFFLRAFNIPIRTRGKLSLLDKAKHQKHLEDLKADLYRMYMDENKSTSEIAIALNLKPPTILKYLRSLDINTKNVGKRFLNHNNSMPNDPKEIELQLKDLYLNQQLSLIEIAEKWGVDFSTISKNLKRFGIPTRKSGRKNCISKKLISKSVATDLPSLKKALIQLHHIEGLSIQEISQLWEISVTTVLNYLRKLNLQKIETSKLANTETEIPLPPQEDPILKLNWDKKNLPQLKLQLETLYVKRKLSLVKIAQIFDRSIPTIRKYITVLVLANPKSEIPLPSQEDPILEFKWDKKNLPQLKLQLETLYVKRKLTLVKIAQIFDRSIPTVKKYITALGLEKPRKRKKLNTQSLANIE